MTALQQLKQQGRREGRQQEEIHIARNMMSEGLSFNLIRKLSGLSEEEIIKLQQEAKS